MNKKLFTLALESIKSTNEAADKISDILCDGSIVTLHHAMEDVIVDMLKEAFPSEDELHLIDWWLYECNYGEDAEVMVNKEEILLDTPEKLYDFLKND